MTNWLRTPRWSPYTVGAGIGVLSWITFAVMGKALGTSTTMVRAVGAAERVVAPEHVESNAYFTKYLGTMDALKPVFEWQFALVVMLIVGALIASRLSGTRQKQCVPSMWKQRFGSSRLLRGAAAFAGGVVLLFGARLAGGCTSGHGISGGLQLAASSWVFMGAMFATGVATAFALYGKSKSQFGADHA